MGEPPGLRLDEEIHDAIRGLRKAPKGRLRQMGGHRSRGNGKKAPRNAPDSGTEKVGWSAGRKSAVTDTSDAPESRSGSGGSRFPVLGPFERTLVSIRGFRSVDPRGEEPGDDRPVQSSAQRSRGAMGCAMGAESGGGLPGPASCLDRGE